MCCSKHLPHMGQVRDASLISDSGTARVPLEDRRCTAESASSDTPRNRYLDIIAFGRRHPIRAECWTWPPKRVSSPRLATNRYHSSTSTHNVYSTATAREEQEALQTPHHAPHLGTADGLARLHVVLGNYALAKRALLLGGRRRLRVLDKVLVLVVGRGGLDLSLALA